MAKSIEKRKFSEREVVAWIRRRTSTDKVSVPVGPGDDAALVRLSSRRLLFTIDTIAEGVDFRLDSATPYQVGRKALAVNLSDIAAMGGKPLFCVASVTLRRGLGERFARAIHGGLASMAGRFSCPLVGGDITVWSEGVVVTVAVAGAPAGRRAITRSGAAPGDRVFVTGTLGGSILGRHLAFTPRLAEGAWLAEHPGVTAMIDISDGLGVDAAHIARESGAALFLDGERIPISAAARRLAAKDPHGALRHALADGEDFELLFTMPPAHARKCRDNWPFRTRLTEIGTVRKGKGVHLVDPDGKEERIDTEGYQHT